MSDSDVGYKERSSFENLCHQHHNATQPNKWRQIYRKDRVMKTKKIILTFFLVACAMPAISQSLKSLQAQIKSMEACRMSIKHVDCNLEILDANIRETLTQLDQLNQQRTPNSQRKASPTLAQGSVQFFTSSISQVDGEILKLSNSTVWELDRSYFGLAFQDVIGLMTDSKNATIYANDNTYRAKLIRGFVATTTGTMATVIDKKGDGAILKTSNGLLLEFSSYDRYDTGWWLPPYPVLIDESKMNMWNLNKGKKVWIQSVL